MSALLRIAAGLESEVFLCEIAERHYDDCCQDFRYGWIDTEVLYKELDEDIVQVHAYHHQEEIAEKLNAATENGAGKHDVPVEQVSCRKADCERHQEGCYVWADGTDWSKNDLFFQDEVIGDEVQKNIEQGVASPACCIAEGLDRHQLPEGNVEKIDNCQYPAFQHGRKDSWRFSVFSWPNA